jgi:cell division protease FtsH
MARQMVINYGMSDIGPWSLLDPSAQSGDVVMRMMARNSMSENLQQRIDEAVKKIAEEAYEVALRHIRDNRWVLSCDLVTGDIVCAYFLLTSVCDPCERVALRHIRDNRWVCCV